MDRIAQVAVVIPVHNEEPHLARALAAVSAAADALQHSQPDTDVAIVVVLDACTDSSGAVAAHIAAADRRITLLPVAFRSVGRSRRAGINLLLTGRLPDSAGADRPQTAGRVWLANTDADSCVPENWLLRQVELADGGADAVLGTVEPDPEGMDGELLRRWHARHPLREEHPHVHGANFGVRASAYIRAGGFPRQRSHEDRALAARLRRHGFRITSTDTVRVLTSGRTEARAPQGFGAYLLALGMESAVAFER
ncbi:glycosyltransferase family 2 protein [Pseudarthrobacter raffinosi]|uniref:glycosyltransferase n=1 Tax=Pseudarthrobacter raffinosi TaxID=2953651 RepID=UPI00208F359C|nr:MULTISPECIES: glycosyltransferase [unclassified Pseudarthrobacter]MCO4238256.1 glycosyltransferase [Pseudarthrobacter sp. MDT3-28]MCO4252356.1 glycosyltransferase [Pseudarthrobacter sp. MDT3-9]MCO4264152.1 glycosyltransferase [Pseudarthrobacter sp. MDT3-26]